MPIRLAIVEDDEPIRQILSEIVRGTTDLELVSVHTDAESALTALPANQPDVVLTDINLPQLSGVECVRRLRPLLPRTQFLMLTVYEDADHIFAALAAGATGYLLKSTSRVELITAIHQVVEGGSPMSSGIARKVVQSFARTDSPPRSDLETLSPREQAVLSLLAQGLLYKEIAESLAISGPTVNTYIRRIYEKLHVRSRSQAIATFLKQS
ncbi:MAG: response regulator transcription factor [Verrucomicrobia bacterium]|nr:response regulator transcription factor [Verrucomicrobiota bacterium]